jgi:hypothetical protein
MLQLWITQTDWGNSGPDELPDLYLFPTAAGLRKRNFQSHFGYSQFNTKFLSVCEDAGFENTDLGSQTCRKTSFAILIARTMGTPDIQQLERVYALYTLCTLGLSYEV